MVSEKLTERFVIRRNGAFFRPNAEGYTNHVIAAGFYTSDEADKYRSVEGVTIVPLSRYQAQAEQIIADASRLLEALSPATTRAPADLRSALEAETMVSVPREPTEEMLLAGANAVRTDPRFIADGMNEARLHWSAMLSAALAPTKEPAA